MTEDEFFKHYEITSKVTEDGFEDHIDKLKDSGNSIRDPKKRRRRRKKKPVGLFEYFGLKQ